MAAKIMVTRFSSERSEVTAQVNHFLCTVSFWC